MKENEQVLMFMMRKIIFMGQAGDDTAVYFDTKNKKILKAKKNVLLDMEATKNNSRMIRPLIGGIPLIFAPMGWILTKFFSKSVYTPSVLIALVLLWTIEAVGLTLLLEQALYSPIRGKKLDHIEPATKAEFRQAIMSNNIWNNFKNKKVTLGKKIGGWCFIVFLCLMTLAILPVGYAINNQGQLLGHPIGSEIVALSLLGMMPFVCILLIWINNPIRWLNVVEKYQKRKL